MAKCRSGETMSFSFCPIPSSCYEYYVRVSVIGLHKLECCQVPTPPTPLVYVHYSDFTPQDNCGPKVIWIIAITEYVEIVLPRFLVADHNCAAGLSCIHALRTAMAEVSLSHFFLVFALKTIILPSPKFPAVAVSTLSLR